MKKIMMLALLSGLLVACSQERTEEQWAKDVYEIMVEASEEGRQLTEDELAEVQEYTHRAKLANTTDLDRAIKAMEFNFYEPHSFSKAKDAADKIFKEL
jgi:outer membrane biogenesis lipoprotein LolB